MTQSCDTVFQAFLNQTLSLEETLAFDGIEGVNGLCHGKSLLHRAIEDNQLSLVKALLAHPDININVRDSDGGTPLRYILRRSRHKMFELLLQRDELDLNLDTVSTLDYPHAEQPVALDLGRRGTVKMVEVWVKSQGDKAWTVRGDLDDATHHRWGHWGGHWETNGEQFSVIDAALLQPNMPVLTYLLHQTDLVPLSVSLEHPVQNSSYYDSQTHLPHPAQMLMDAMKNPQAVEFWKALARDKTQGDADRARAILNWMEKRRLHRHLPSAGREPVKKPSKNRL